MSSNLSTQLYQTLTHPDTMRDLLVGFFRDSKDQAIALLQRNGVAISNSAPMKAVRLAWLKAIKDSESFRDQAATTLTTYVGKFTRPGNVSNFVEGSTINPVYFNDVTALTPTSVAPLTITAPTDISGGGSGGGSSSDTSTGDSSDSSGGGFWSSLGSIFTPSVIQAGIKTGLQAVSTNMTAQANQTSEKNALQIEQARLAQAQVQQQTAATSHGLSTGAIIGIVAGSLLVITLVIVIVVRKK